MLEFSIAWTAWRTVLHRSAASIAKPAAFLSTVRSLRAKLVSAPLDSTFDAMQIRTSLRGSRKASKLSVHYGFFESGAYRWAP